MKIDRRWRAERQEKVIDIISQKKKSPWKLFPRAFLVRCWRAKDRHAIAIDGGYAMAIFSSFWALRIARISPSRLLGTVRYFANSMEKLPLP